MARQHSPLQQIKEARQIAKDFNLILSEKKVGERTDYFVFRKVPGGRTFIGKRSSPAAIRYFIEKVADAR